MSKQATPTSDASASEQHPLIDILCASEHDNAWYGDINFALLDHSLADLALASDASAFDTLAREISQQRAFMLRDTHASRSVAITRCNALSMIADLCIATPTSARDRALLASDAIAVLRAISGKSSDYDTLLREISAIDDYGDSINGCDAIQRAVDSLATTTSDATSERRAIIRALLASENMARISSTSEHNRALALRALVL